MNFYNQMFNPQYVNPEQYALARQQMDQYNYEQNKEVAKAVKAIHDFCEATKKLDPQYQQIAFNACLCEMARQFGWQ